MKRLRLKTHHFHSKLLCQKPMLRQIEWQLQNRPITKSGVLPVTTLFFWKIFSCFRTSWKELIWCTNDPSVHIHIFCERWSLILGCFLPVSILKTRRQSKFNISKSSHRRWSVKKSVLKNFAEFTGKHLSQSLRPATLLKKRLWQRCFPLNFAKLLFKHLFYGTPLNDCFCISGLIFLKPWLCFNQLVFMSLFKNTLLVNAFSRKIRKILK